MAVVTNYIGKYWSSATPNVWTAATSDAFKMVRDTGVVCTPVACTNAGTATADTEKLVITPIRPGTKLLVIITQITNAITVTVDAGDYWFAKKLDAVTVDLSTSKAFTFTPARYQTKKNSQIVITMINNNVAALSATTKYQVIEMPDVDLNVVKTLGDTQ